MWGGGALTLWGVPPTGYYLCSGVLTCTRPNLNWESKAFSLQVKSFFVQLLKIITSILSLSLVILHSWNLSIPMFKCSRTSINLHLRYAKNALKPKIKLSFFLTRIHLLFDVLKMFSTRKNLVFFVALFILIVNKFVCMWVKKTY